ncbi:hypothetical protein [Streptomyces tropicalis]|uniref:hypothetical protein n=1 Tax=Streptomyces tropicalis TaxID=3034234 RepID=UPI0028BDA245|nr:hypothetical protein [Streptomyces tropicalis]
MHTRRGAPPARGVRRYTGAPAAGAGSRRTSWVPVPSWADDDGSAEGWDVSGGGGGDTGGGSDAGGVWVGTGWPWVGVGCPGAGGCPGFAGVPGFPGGTADALPAADGEADDDGLPSFRLPPCPCVPSPVFASRPRPPPDPARPPSGAPPARRSAECDGLAPPPVSSPTLMQPAVAATAATATARRTGTFMGRTGATSGADAVVAVPNSPPPRKDTPLPPV